MFVTGWKTEETDVKIFWIREKTGVMQDMKVAVATGWKTKETDVRTSETGKKIFATAKKTVKNGSVIAKTRKRNGKRKNNLEEKGRNKPQQLNLNDQLSNALIRREDN